MNPYSALIVDDEPPARFRVRQLLGIDPEIGRVAEAADGASALGLIRRVVPDLLFLDIQMPELDGLELLGALPADRRPAVTFVTAHDEYALAAFNHHAVDYLLKPFTDARFFSMLARLKDRARRTDPAELSAQIEAVLAALRRADRAAGAPSAVLDLPSDRVAVRVSGDVLLLRQSEIRWIEGAGDYLRLHLGKGAPLVRETFRELLQRLDPARFVRIHKSAVVNTACVAKLRPGASGDYQVELDDGTRLTVSRVYRQDLGEFRDGSWTKRSG